MKKIILTVVFHRLLTMCFLLVTIQVTLAEKVVLQLKWEHEFQFAGYYAAQWQGYYQQNDIDVEIRSVVSADKTFKRTVDEVVSGRADFGIGSLDILNAIDRGEELLILTPVFQKSPSAIVTLKDLKIESVNDLVGLRLGILDEDYLFDETMSMLRFHGVDPNKIDIKAAPPLVNSLLDGVVDAVITFGVSAEYEAQELGVDINLVEISKFGTNFFGDVLYTRKSLYQQKPKMVKDFINASLKGWEYALANEAEIAKKISLELPREVIKYDDFLKYNLFFADYISHYTMWPEVELGYLDYDRWNKIYNDLRYIGMFENSWNLNEFIIDDQNINCKSLMVKFLILIFVILALFNLILYKKTRLYRYLMVFIFAMFAFGYYYYEKNLKDEYRQKLRFETLVELESVKSKLSGLINSNISLLKGFASHISHNPEITDQEFQKYAAEIFDYGKALINFAAAPKLVVDMVYPLPGNEGVIGLDYTMNSMQIDSVLDTKSSQQVVISGPVNLVQGGDALVIRSAIFEQGDTQRFWGIISAPIDLKVLLSLAGIFRNDLIAQMAIKKTGDNEQMIHGNQSLFGDIEVISITLEVGDTVWQINARPAIGWLYPAVDLWSKRLTALLLMSALFYFLYFRNSQRTKQRLFKEAIKRNERLLLEVGELAHVGGWRVNNNGEISQWTAVSQDVLGDHFPTSLNHIREFMDLFSDVEARRIDAAINGAVKHGMSFDIEVKYINQSDQTRWIRLISDEIIQEEDGFEVTGAIQDVTYYKNVNELIEYQATHDTLTGLFNRYSLHEEASRMLQQAEQKKSQLMALFIDVDDFKNINDSLGHHAGDQFLRSVAGSLKKVLHEHDILARYSGDEFVTIVDFVNQQDLHVMVQKIRDSIRKEFDINGTHVFCSCSVGVAIYPEHSESIDDLVAKADMAMYSAKQKGKNGFEIYSPALLADAERKAALKTELQNALVKQSFEVYFQPIVDLTSGNIHKFEALLRWFNAEGELHNTEEFIAVAEEAGLVVEIDLFVLKQLLKKFADDSLSGLENWDVAINVSPIMFNSQKKVLNLWLDLLEQLARYCQVTIEITERSLVGNPERALKILNKLNDRNIKVAIDDFGVGYSSLNYLTRFPIHVIKIDRSFTNQIGIDEKTNALIRTILSLAVELGLEVIAEGIETKQQHDFMAQYQCRFGQGYLFSKAIPYQQARNLFEAEANNR